jgi:hypothetical protein
MIAQGSAGADCLGGRTSRIKSYQYEYTPIVSTRRGDERFYIVLQGPKSLPVESFRFGRHRKPALAFGVGLDHLTPRHYLHHGVEPGPVVRRAAHSIPAITAPAIRPRTSTARFWSRTPARSSACSAPTPACFFLCARCHDQVLICSCCDRGTTEDSQRYAGGEAPICLAGPGTPGRHGQRLNGASVCFGEFWRYLRDLTIGDHLRSVRFSTSDIASEGR